MGLLTTAVGCLSLVSGVFLFGILILGIIAAPAMAIGVLVLALYMRYCYRYYVNPGTKGGRRPARKSSLD